MTEIRQVDILIRNVSVIQSAKPYRHLKDAVIAVKRDRIDFVGSAFDAPQFLAKRELNLQGSLVTPGFVNVHTHTILTMVRGVAEDMGFAPAYTPWVPHGHEVTPGEALALSRLGALEAMLFGSTLINDSYVHADLTLPAMAELGLRVYTCGRIHDVDFSRVHLGEWKHHVEIGERTLFEAIDLHAKWSGKFNGRTGVQITPHAPDTCSRALLKEISDYVLPRGIRVSTHLSQSRIENQRIQERDRCTPTQLLDSVGLLNDRLIAAHGIYMSDQDIQRAGAVRMNLAHIPKGNATGGQISPTRKMHRTGINLTLATDNMHADMIEVMRWGLCMGRIQEDRIDDGWQPTDLLHMATHGGAKAMGLGHEVGVLDPGYKADLVCIDMNRAHLTPRINDLGNLMHTGQGRDVTHVMVNGEFVVENGRATRMNEEQILREAQQAATALWHRARQQIA
jgi:5-methylthioadenosine/S-adenosylhomocysteine deaminase